MKPLHGNRRQTLLFPDFCCIGRFTRPIKPKRTVAKKTHQKSGCIVTPLEGTIYQTTKGIVRC